MTLFGMNEKKKRGIVVPVMALAVCAVAMVGLGFALQTNVTTESNTVSVFQIDLNDDSSVWNTNNAVTNNPVNGVLSVIMTSHKTTNGGLTYDYDGTTYLKIFSNLTGYSNPTTSVKFTESTGKITDVTIKISKGGVAVESPITIANGSTEDLPQLDINTVYKVEIVGITSSNPLGPENGLNMSFEFTAESDKSA